MPRVKRIIVFILAAAVIAGAAGVFIGRYHVLPVLMYHSVSPDAPEDNLLAVTDAVFERQMRFLKEHRYNVMRLEDAAGLIRRGKRIPSRAVVITFDDGYRNTFTHAFPILKKYDIPATAFIIVNEVGRSQGDRLDWSDIRQMQESGLVAIGSHCLGPEPLINIRDDGVVRHEIFASKKALEEKLGVRVNFFSYPEGMFTPYIRQLVIDAGYTAAVATNPGKHRFYPSNDIFALKRLRISASCGNLFVFWFKSSGYYTFFMELKRLYKRRLPVSRLQSPVPATGDRRPATAVRV